MSDYALNIRLPKRDRILNFADYLDFATDLERLAVPSAVFVDLSQIEFAHANGMAPLVAVIRHLTDLGWSFDVALPDDDFLFEFFQKAGWVTGISGESSGERIPGTTYMPLTEYSSAEELNPILNTALEHFSRQSVYGPGVLEALEWSLNEIAGNVLDHAGGVSGWLQLSEQPKKGLIEVVVVDCGRGICASLRERFPDLVDDRDAVQRAVEKGVTRNQAVGQGNGLAGTLRIAIAANGYVNVYSGHGLLRYMPSTRVVSDRGSGRSPSRAAENLYLDHVALHPGTIVSLTLPTKASVDVTKALWGHRPSSMFEFQYASDHDSFAASFVVAEEGTGFGNRASARPLRQRLHNLLNLWPNQRICVDFAGVNLASASFLDEFLARLAKEIGVATFFQRVLLVNMNSLLQQSLDAVLEQRIRA